ncbi:hypothetical protein [Tardiphaga robiniae]|uniref:hypothetical protein n=1 Tax=Tardiphaga robiniae TaxID=943830 RepID=UPI001586E1B5|nr:hypothetical protein [Tardiphaga robiniae]NUU42296.1 hypothetical protein [Tardiphaga robiniae]
MRNFIALTAATFLSGCASPNLAGVSSPITALLTTASDAAALDQELADEFAKQSATLYFLSNKKETCLDNDGLTPVYTKKKDIERQEAALLKLRLADLYNLSAYADTLAQFDQDKSKRVAQRAAVNRIIAAGAEIAGYSVVFEKEAKAVSLVSSAVIQLANDIDSNVTNRKIMQTARDMQPKVDAMITRLKERFHIVGDRAQLYVNAWRECTREKFIYIRDYMAQPSKPVSVVDLDSNYYTFRTQYRNYLNKIPHIEKSAFEKIRQANNMMVAAQTEEDFAKGAEALAATVGQLVSTYKTVNESAKTLFGS